jgi:pyrophosphate--fructose-6-phosphate 1-phosphotransferase
MDELGCVNIFLSGAWGGDHRREMVARGQEPARDAFRHVKLDKINPGSWFAKQFAGQVGAEKTMVQKSGYFSRSAAANAEDLRLIKGMTDLAVDCALRGEGGVIGHDEESGDRLRAIEFPRIKGGKPFDTNRAWFDELLAAIGQCKGPKVTPRH